MRKFKKMTNREWVLKHCGAFHIDLCPFRYELENSLGSGGCPNDREWSIKTCEKCWELPAKQNGKYFLKEVKK